MEQACLGARYTLQVEEEKATEVSEDQDDASRDRLIQVLARNDEHARRLLAEEERWWEGFGNALAQEEDDHAAMMADEGAAGDTTVGEEKVDGRDIDRRVRVQVQPVQFPGDGLSRA